MHGGMARRGRAEPEANETGRPGEKPLSYLPKHRKHVANDGGTKLAVDNRFIRGLLSVYPRFIRGLPA